MTTSRPFTTRGSSPTLRGSAAAVAASTRPRWRCARHATHSPSWPIPGRVPSLLVEKCRTRAGACESAARKAAQVLDPPSEAELLVLGLLASDSVGAADRAAAVSLPQHGPLAHAFDLPKARRQLTRRRRRARRHPRSPRARAISYVNRRLTGGTSQEDLPAVVNDRRVHADREWIVFHKHRCRGITADRRGVFANATVANSAAPSTSH